jgi:hypothetical protein
MADFIVSDIRDPEARYTNPAKLYPGAKKPRYDPSQDRAGWVSGFSAALARRDSEPQISAKGLANSGWTAPTRGHPTRGHPTHGHPTCGQCTHTTLGRSYNSSWRGSLRGGGYRKLALFMRGHSI